ncbi:cupin domain-containing protein [Tenggerimyces flavus]|uniref:Cupin domain-containing protein n=1 Tax=Tenggerimyces flavus TaxID=1708749 RepID=A0ABV7YMK8_9ACTN|nr:cupin domain-containing protein [Tenggerimyces flavus]MBM7789619.1 quercetin dioxygenase-like cupin family protein [Tenggerimyces flavus]
MTVGESPIRTVDAEIIESPDGGMRDVVLIADALGAKNLCAGFVWIAPGATIHEDAHPFDEVYYVVRGTAEIILEGVRHVMTSGDVINIPATRRHRVHNFSDEVFEIFWCIGGAMSQLEGVEEELATWPRVDATKGWHLVA